MRGQGSGLVQSLTKRPLHGTLPPASQTVRSFCSLPLLQRVVNIRLQKGNFTRPSVKCLVCSGSRFLGRLAGRPFTCARTPMRREPVPPCAVLLDFFGNVCSQPRQNSEQKAAPVRSTN